MDTIHEWLRRLITLGLDTNDSVFDQLLSKRKSGAICTSTTTETAAEAPTDAEIVSDFFECASKAGSVLLFYLTDIPHLVENVNAPAVAIVNENSAEDGKFFEDHSLAKDADVDASESIASDAKFIMKKLNVSLNVVPDNAEFLPTIFLIKLHDGPINVTKGATDNSAISRTANQTPEVDFEHSNVEVCISSGSLLASLEGTICHVYLPILDPFLSGERLKSAAQGWHDTGKERNTLEDSTLRKNYPSAQQNALNVIDAVKHELKGNLTKFASEIISAAQQLQREIYLNIPDINIEVPENHVNDYALIERLEKLVMDWSKSISSIVEQESRKIPRRRGPLAEIEFWRERNAVLGTIHEQVNMANVQGLLKLLELAESSILLPFRYHYTELTKLYIEAKDNIKFLATLERHFKTITAGSFYAIAETLPSMMNAIRMVWIISRHYNTDERMVPLMERIAFELSDRVSAEMNVQILLENRPDQAISMIQQSKNVLELWYSTYMRIRERIEASGTDHRWEFDRKRLFEQPNYMAKVCDHLLEIAVVLDQFNKFLGPELKSVTGDSQGIDRVRNRVDALVDPFTSVPFQIFDRGFKTSWDALMAEFREKVIEIELMTRKFIDSSFQKLRSAEGAFNLLQNFQNIQSRETINKQMMEKYQDILMQYTKELEQLKIQFYEKKDNPPLYKHYPPVAGSIAWAQSIYLRAKKPILRFRAVNDLLKSPFGEEVKERYLVLARAIDAYIKDLHAEWKATVPNLTNEYLRQPILGPNLLDADKTETSGVLYRLPQPPYYANFSHALKRIIRESKYLDRLGFEIPEEALNVTLQEDKYHHYVQEITLMLQKYDLLLQALTPVETHLLMLQLSDLQQVLRVGFSPLNWNSQRIITFIDNCNRALNQFSNLVSQIHKSSTMVEDIVMVIEKTVLIDIQDFQGAATEASEFYELLEKNRVHRIESLVVKYRSIGPLLIKVEELVAGVNTGTSHKMAAYYLYWERRIFNAITKMIIASMVTYQALLNVHMKDIEASQYYQSQLKRQQQALRIQLRGIRYDVDGSRNKSDQLLDSMDSKDPGAIENQAVQVIGMPRTTRRPPVCKVEASMNGKDVIVTPSLSEMYKYLSKSVKLIVESAKAFVRWMHGTCRETEAVIVNEEEEPITFTFYSDISQNPYVLKMTLSLNQEIHKGLNIVNKYLDSWRRYDVVYNLWNTKRRQALEKLVDKRPPCVYFDTRMAQYARLAESVRQQPTEKDTDLVKIDCLPVSLSIAKQAEMWRYDYGRILYDLSKRKLVSLSQQMSVYEQELEANPDDLESLKSLLNSISTVLDKSMEIELEYTDIMERFRTLQTHCITVDTADKEQAMNLADRWHQLLVAAKSKDMQLVHVKTKFRAVTTADSVEFYQECKGLRDEYRQYGPSAHAHDLDKGLEVLAEYKTRLKAFQTRRQILVNAEHLFALPITSYGELQEVVEEMDKEERVYALYCEAKEFMSMMASVLWSELDVPSMVSGVEDLEKRAKSIPTQCRNMQTFIETEKQITSFKESLPLIQSLKNDAMKVRHWEKLMSMTNVKFDMNPSTFTLANLFAMKLYRFGTDIGIIVNAAMQEQKIEQEILKIEDSWSKAVLDLVKYKKNGQDRGAYILRSADEIKLQLDDHMLNLQTISSSRFVASISDRVRKWEKRLNAVIECLRIWFIVQQKWMYLESIFTGAQDIRQQLAEEAKKFDAVDKAWKAIMNSTYKNANVLDACTADNRLETLESLSGRLDKCQKSLTDYLNTKRNAFPRFYFISDDELLSVLGSSDPTCIQVHLLKMFDNVKQITFQPLLKHVSAMESSEGETFTFRSFSNVEGPVESWMANVEAEMRTTLLAIVKEGIFEYGNLNRDVWLDQVLGMVSLVASQIWWTWEVEDVFKRVRDGEKYAMKILEAKLTSQLRYLVQMVRKPLQHQLRIKVNTLLTIDAHARDIVDSFVRDSILNEREFAWESQLRFYWKKSVNDVIISQCTGDFRYGYEYMGLNGRLVITPLTDRCYMTLTQALTFKLGGSAAGPAGTGKTETVKDLAKSLALPCYVINCGEGLDYKAMGSIFSGLLQVGAWGCCDEFNRINIEVLSVVSSQLRAIQTALVCDKSTVDIGFGSEIKIYRIAGFATCGFFITMNPGYAGRTELPDNLKALFRPVTMVVPDLLMIAQIMLFSEGFEEAVTLAKKMIVLYKLSQQQLSKQYHYDFGLRALKSVLVMAGSLKREYSDTSEEVILMRALRDSNMPKFVYEDVPLFKVLIDDLISGLDCPRVGYDGLRQAIEKEMENQDFRMQDERVFQDQIDKIIQLHETMLVRHTTIIVGPTGGGKSVILNTLATASKAALEVNVKMYTLNPKAQPITSLYGTMDSITRDWTDGILSKLFRDLNQHLPAGKENEKRWLVYDGDVDAVWVENMNSVMDDNKLLTLPNGERIRLQPHCSMICETFDLQYASPATISRCGMVWVDPNNLGYRPYYERWLRRKFPADEDAASKTGASFPDHNAMIDLFDRYIPKCMEFVLEGARSPSGEGSKCQQVFLIGSMEMCKQLCNMLDAFVFDVEDNTDMEEKKSDPNSQLELTSSDLECMFMFCIIWSLGANLVEPSRVSFDQFLRNIADGPMPPFASSLYSYYYCRKAHKWQAWETQALSYEEPSPFSFTSIFVPTADSVLYRSLLDHICRKGKRPLLLFGERGTAKTVNVQNFLRALDPQCFSELTLNFSSRTSSMDVQTSIEGNVDKRSGKVYGPAAGKKLIVFIDDLNMPKIDMYGTQQPIAFLHFVMNRNGLYDRGKDLEFRFLKDLIFLGAMGTPSGGRRPVDPRFIALFNVIHLTPPSTGVLRHIYGSIIASYFRNFNPSVRDISTQLTSTLLQIFKAIPEKCPPTPSKFHYIFNLRDIGRVCQGLCLATPDKFETSKEVVRLFRNELTRILCDRLIDENDHQLVQEIFSRSIKENFPADVAEHALSNPIVFGDFAECISKLSGGQSDDAMLYQDLESYERVQSLFEQVLDIYNTDHSPITLVLFEMVLEHLCRLLRIIKNTYGHALLVGVGGSGKQSLSRLAAFTAGYELFKIFLSRNYGEQEFREDLKTLYGKLGSRKVLFLFTDADAVNESFFELINNMLTTGTVQGLFEPDERDSVASCVAEDFKASGIIDTSDNLWKFYIDRCKRNLHIVLAMSPSGNNLRNRCRNFPGLISGTIIDWFFQWPQDALQKVAEYFLQDENVPDDCRDSVTRHLVYTHLRVVGLSNRFAEELRRRYYVTPKNYLEYLSTYRQQLKDNHLKISSSIQRLNGGLEKLVEASKAVDQMQVDLSEKKVIVDDKTLACESLIQTIEEKSRVATKQQEIATEAQTECEKASIIIAKEKDEADAALMEALPAVEAAAAALQDLSKADLTEIKSFSSPPPLVMSVCMCVLILKPTGQELELDWKGAKVMLSNPSLLTLLKEYEKGKISSKMISKIKTYFKNPDFNIENMKTISKAGAGLLIWVDAIVKYYDVAKNVDPLRQKVKSMEKEQAVKEQEVEDLKSTISLLNQELNMLSVQYDQANTELQMLKTQADQMTKRLQAANKLLTGLASERIRWIKDVAALHEQRSRLTGDCLLSACFLSYAGAFSFDYRMELIYTDIFENLKAREIPITSSFKLEQFLINETTTQKWISEGLPADEHSVQNGILTVKSSRFPLCIDPQQQAVSWIKEKESSHNLTVKTLADSDFMKHLELAVQFGNPFLFENVNEELDPILDPILERNTYMEGSVRMIKLGDKNVEWDPNFRLYLTTKLANPHFSPEVMGKTMIINYSVTQKGLENQLLDVVVAHERPDLEEQYRQLVSEMSDNTQMIVELEDTLLRELSNSTGNILDNQELIETLDETKSKAIEIGNKLQLSSFTKDEISRARAVYTSVAVRGSIMYFAMTALSNILKMYEISLASFLVVFNTSLNHAKRDVSMEKRLRFMIQSITELTYDYTCTGIFERHKLMFAFQMTCMILRNSGNLNEAELNFFLKGNSSIEPATTLRPDDLSWISSIGWKDLILLKEISSSLSNIVADVISNPDNWKEWNDLECPEAEALPLGYSERLTELQKLLIIRCFRQDRVYNAMKSFVSEIMTKKYIQPPVLDYARIYNQSAPTAPIVCILSPGADPLSDIQTLSEEHGFSGHRFRSIALGQGQGPLAEQMVTAGYSRGNWVLLQNCHLLSSWLKVLEKMLLSMQKPHKDFRLWLTTEPTDQFPLGILQRSLKVVTEPPDGLKQNMRGLYAKLDQSVLDECPHTAYHSLVYVLCFLHAVVLERRKYGKIGWNVCYDFNDSDFNISRKLLNLYLYKADVNGDEQLPWGSLRYIIGDAMYGGRVSDDYDRRILSTYLQEYMGDFLFDDFQPFYFSRSGFDYCLPLPDARSIESYRQHVEILPLANSPAVFGLHPNAEIGYYTNMSKCIWKDLISLQPRSKPSGAGVSREDRISSIAGDIQSKIPPLFDVALIRKQMDRLMSPTQVVLLQELNRWNNLTTQMVSSLLEVQKALAGEIGMSEDLEALGNSLFDGYIPSIWRMLCPDTEKPLASWIEHYVQRHAQYIEWIRIGALKVVWLSGLSSPEAYLNALVQTACRAKKWPLDNSTLYTVVTSYTQTSDIPAGDLDIGWFVRGLYLEGASWNRAQQCLAPQRPKQLVEELPFMHIIPVEISQLKLQNTFRAPVYVTQSRRDAMGVGLVFEADLRSLEHQSHWILQGVALFLNIDT